MIKNNNNIYQRWAVAFGVKGLEVYGVWSGEYKGVVKWLCINN